MAIATTPAGRWFRRVVWLGIVANVALAIPTIAAPDQMIEFSGLPTVDAGPLGAVRRRCC